MGFFNELAKLFKGKPPERHGAHGVTKEGERRNKKAAYLASYFERPGTLQALNSLIESHDGVADAVHELSTGDESVHGDPQSLLRLGAGLRYEAARAENQGITDANEAIEPLMQAIVERSSRYLLQAKDQLKEKYARQGKNFHETAWLAQLLK